MSRTSEPTASAQQGVAAVDRAISILAAFRRNDDSLSLAELADRTGIYKSTILRIAASLVTGRLLLRLPDGRFKIGSEALRLGMIYQQNLNLRDVLLPKMRKLASITGESVVFYVREGNKRICVLRVEFDQPIRFHIVEGDAMPLEKGSGGVVILAFSGEPGEPYETVRRRFYYTSLGERSPDTAGIAAPILDRNDELIGIMGISGPASRFNAAAAADMVPHLLRMACAATLELGGNASAFEAPIHSSEKRFRLSRSRG